MKQTYIVALEIGSSKIKGAVGTIDESGVLTVQSVEEEPIVDCVRYGVISNAGDVAHHANQVIDRLEAHLGGRSIQSVYVALGGRSLRSDAREVERQLPGEMEITRDMIEQMMVETSESSMPQREKLDVVPREFYVGKTRVAKPIGTLGSSVRMLSNLITCRPQLKRNLIHLLEEKLDLNIAGWEVRQLAEADLVLTPEERRLGCMLVDCGAETTTVSIYTGGSLRYLATLPLGSRNITRDISALNILEERAEEIKRHLGNARYSSASATQDTDGIDVAAVNKHVVARAGEIIANINNQLTLAGVKAEELPAGIILVGQASRLAGFSERLAEATSMKVRLGNPMRRDVVIANPRISLVDSVDVISVLYAATRHPMECVIEPEPVVQPQIKTEPEPQPVVAAQEEKPVEKPSTPTTKKSNFFVNIAERISNLLEERDDDDDEDDLREDD